MSSLWKGVYDKMRVLKFRQAIYSKDKFDHWHHWGFLPDLSFVGPDSINGLAHALANSQQFTGLSDKSGKEIYEGDIVRITDAPTIKGEVVWQYLAWQMKDGGMLSNFDTNYLEIIGNIHQNPELIEEKEND